MNVMRFVFIWLVEIVFELEEVKNEKNICF